MLWRSATAWDLTAQLIHSEDDGIGAPDPTSLALETYGSPLRLRNSGDSENPTIIVPRRIPP